MLWSCAVVAPLWLRVAVEVQRGTLPSGAFRRELAGPVRRGTLRSGGGEARGSVLKPDGPIKTIRNA